MCRGSGFAWIGIIVKSQARIRIRVNSWRLLLLTVKAKYGFVAARKKGRSCQGVKYVFDAHTSKASKRLKVVLLHLWRVNVKTTGGFIYFSLGDFHTDKIAP